MTETNDILTPLSSADDLNDTSNEQTNLIKEAEHYSLSDLPGPVYFIIVNELCERFGYYGLRAILIKYFTEGLGYEETQAQAIYSYVTSVVYVMPILGGVVADSWLGKFRTIFYFSIVYILGSGLLAGSAVDKTPWIAFLSLFFIAMGTGGIKPCVSSFGADQLKTNNPAAVSTYFHMFYFAINVGSTASILVTPIVRDQYGYAIAFSLPACLLVIALLIFLFGKRYYVMVPATGSVLALVLSVICTARSERNRVLRSGEDVSHIILARPTAGSSNTSLPVSSTYTGGNSQDSEDVFPSSVNQSQESFESPSNAAVSNVVENREVHWLDYAKLRFTYRQVEEVKMVTNIIPVLATLPIFWMLFDQQGSTWVLQANRMDRYIGSFEILSEQVQALNAVFVLICVPIFDRCIYPFLRNRGFPVRPLSRMVVGMILTGIAFAMAGVLDLQIKDYATRTEYVKIYFQVPQYLVITMAEVLVSTTGLEFAYSSAPKSMKGTITAIYLLTSSLGNILSGLIFSGLRWEPYMFSFLCTAFMAVNVVIFSFVVCQFTPMEHPADDESDDINTIESVDNNDIPNVYAQVRTSKSRGDNSFPDAEYDSLASQ